MGAGVRQVPELVDVERYCNEIGTTVDPLKFYQYYSNRNWVRNGEPIADWKEVVRQWASTQYKRPQNTAVKVMYQNSDYWTVEEAERQNKETLERLKKRLGLK